MKEPKDQFEHHLASFRTTPAPAALREKILVPQEKGNTPYLIFAATLAAIWVAIAAIHLNTPSPERNPSSTAARSPIPPTLSPAILLTATDIDRILEGSF